MAFWIPPTYTNCRSYLYYGRPASQMRTLYFCPVASFFLLLLFARLISVAQIGCLPYLHTWCGLIANLECRSEMCCTRLAGNSRRKNDPKNCCLCTIARRTSLSGWIFATKPCIDSPKKNLLSSNISSTCPHNTANFGPNFFGFRVLAALLHGTLVMGISQTLRRWTEGATYIWQGGLHLGHWPTF